MKENRSTARILVPD